MLGFTFPRSTVMAMSMLGTSIPVGAQTVLCYPPESPWVPQAEADFRKYVDIVSEDFQTYFTQVTEYFRCMDSQRMQVFNEAKRVSELHEQFWTRAEELGLTEEAAMEEEEINSGYAITNN